VGKKKRKLMKRKKPSTFFSLYGFVFCDFFGFVAGDGDAAVAAAPAGVVLPVDDDCGARRPPMLWKNASVRSTSAALIFACSCCCSGV
jgi:hypothetical protein